MIRLPEKHLPRNILSALTEYQKLVDERPTFPERVVFAKSSFSSRNRRGNRTFDKIKEVLTEMCSGAVRCCYCEDSKADEIEHIRPKNIYPAFTFLWFNLLYACGPCNGPKNNKFSIFLEGSRIFQNITPPRINHVPAPPPTGDMVLINPRTEDPMDFFILDLIDTFYFVEVHDDTTEEYQRANYTIETLGLNSRDYLVLARKNAFYNYYSRLFTFHVHQNEDVPPQDLWEIKQGILNEHHPTVWKEMQRQHLSHPKLKALFAAVPDALNW